MDMNDIKKMYPEANFDTLWERIMKLNKIFSGGNRKKFIKYFQNNFNNDEFLFLLFFAMITLEKGVKDAVDKDDLSSMFR